MPRRKTGTEARPSPKRASRKTAQDDGLERAFVEALALDFLGHGASAIARVREDDPVTYMKLCAQVLPKALINSIDPLESLSDDELLERARQLAQKAGLGFHPDPD